MTFARHQFELATPQDDGRSLLDHYRAYENATEKVHPNLLNAPKLPPSCRRLWSDFIELHTSRGSTGWGAARITYQDIDAWQRVNRVTLSAFDLNCIRKVDDLWMSEFAPKPKESKH